MPGAGYEHPAKRAEETMPIYLPEVIGRPRVPSPSHHIDPGHHSSASEDDGSPDVGHEASRGEKVSRKVEIYARGVGVNRDI